jgi:hypothetical protein
MLAGMTDPASGIRPGPGGKNDGMQRVRIGLTGLGFVFVAVLLATALTGAPESEPAVTTNRTMASNEQTEAPKEPLAELGVTPGNADTTGNAATSNETRRAFR